MSTHNEPASETTALAAGRHEPQRDPRAAAAAGGEQPSDEGSCCTPAEQASCCEPSAKATCCGSAAAGGCGCR